MTELETKKSFVKDLSKVFVDNKVANIIDIDYVALQYQDKWVDEYLVVAYKGGAIQARVCTANSMEATFQELSTMLYSSQIYAQDTETYKFKLESSDFSKII